MKQIGGRLFIFQNSPALINEPVFSHKADSAKVIL